MGKPATSIVPATPREYLFGLMLHGVKLGLNNIRRLLAEDGAPHARYPAVHIAGTNGKGSVVAMLDAMLLAAGYHTGRFTSPHLIELTERFQLAGKPVTDAALDAAIAHFRRIAETMEPPPTFFEVNTAVAFHLFAQRPVDAALIEVGMGGRFDATNVLHPHAGAITSIDLEHTHYLGDTREKIAYEKAGIIKAGMPLVLGETKPGPRDVILGRAAEMGSPVHLLGRDFQYTLTGDPWRPVFTYEAPGHTLGPTPLGLAGSHQGANAAVAVSLARLLRPAFPQLDDAAIAAGLETVRWPCRIERVLADPPVVVDTSHTVAGASFLQGVFERAITVLSVCEDKPAAAIAEALKPFTERFVLTQFTGKRAMPVASLSKALGASPHDCAMDMRQALAMGMALARPDTPLLVTGSVFAAGEARELLMHHHGAPPVTFV